MSKLEYEVRTEPRSGRVLAMTDGKTEVACALDFGIRILHLSCVGMQNLFYEQPQDLSDGLCTPEGWVIHGGHRLWCAPESDLSYYPDNAPVQYELLPDGVRLTQPDDPWLNVRKRLVLQFAPDGDILVQQSVENVGEAPVTLASWGVNTLAGGGHAEIWFDGGAGGGFNPTRGLSLWGDTSLADERVSFAKERVYARHLPRSEYFKLGLYSKSGRAEFANRGQRLKLTFGSDDVGRYPDGGCNFELFLDPNVMELETLGPVCTLATGQRASHWERWHVCRDGEGGGTV